jgi:hypothetical protein
MDRDRALLRHFLAAIAYRTQKAVRGAPRDYPEFSVGHQVRTPIEIVRHMTNLMGFVASLLQGDAHPAKPGPLPTFDGEIARFHETLQSVGDLLASNARLREISTTQLLQGPLSDVMTHVGQLALLRRLADAPIPPEDFIYADIQPERLGREQAPPARPDKSWPEAIRKPNAT